MCRVAKLLRTEVPLWPFHWFATAVFPLLLLAFGGYRVWVIAATPFEEHLGVIVTIDMALLWSLVFLSVMPSRRTASEHASASCA